MSAVKPAVSVIMPAYDVTAYIATALDSVFAQTFTAFEVIVVNDGCPDSSNLERVLDPYASRIRYLKQNNGGVGAARRTAVLASEAPLIAQLDPDDWWERDYLEVQLRLLESNAAVDLIYPDGFYFGDPALSGRRLMEQAPSTGEVTLCALLEGRVNINYSALIRKDAIVAAGNFDPDLRTSEDFDLWVRILHSGRKAAFHRAPLLHYRLRKDSLTARSIDFPKWIVRVLDKTKTTLTLTDEESTALESRRTAVQMELELTLGKEAIKQKNWGAARWHIELYRSYRPSPKLSAVLLLLRLCPWLLSTSLSTRDRLLRTGLLKAKRPQQA